MLRHSTSELISESGRRRFSDVFDTAQRAAAGVESSRAALAEALDAYRGAEARQATEVTKILTVFMALVAIVSLGVFVALGWIHRPSGRSAGALLGRGLAEAARTPAQLVGAVFEISTKPLRTVAGSVAGRRRPRPMHFEDREPPG